MAFSGLCAYRRAELRVLWGIALVMGEFVDAAITHFCFSVLLVAQGAPFALVPGVSESARVGQRNVNSSSTADSNTTWIPAVQYFLANLPCVVRRIFIVFLVSVRSEKTMGT